MRGKSELNLSPSDQADAACCWRLTNGGFSPAQHRDGNVVSTGRNKGGTDWQRDGNDDHRDEDPQDHRKETNRLKASYFYTESSWAPGSTQEVGAARDQDGLVQS